MKKLDFEKYSYVIFLAKKKKNSRFFVFRDLEKKTGFFKKDLEKK